MSSTGPSPWQPCPAGELTRLSELLRWRRFVRFGILATGLVLAGSTAAMGTYGVSRGIEYLQSAKTGGSDCCPSTDPVDCAPAP